ncbi:MAG: HAMP domain-containing histidine kinase [Actinobacteria bacterium]|nr:HAMP domain-containing histidine kinase [Actinomycetota bacterium]
MTLGPTSPPAPRTRTARTGPRPTRVWRQSLLLRVTVTTLVLSLIVVGLLGLLLLSRITTGLLESAERTAITEASAGLSDAQRLSSAADTGGSTASPSSIVDTIVASLATRAGSPPQYDVLLLADDAELSGAPERGTNLVSDESVPPTLRDAVTTSGRQSWTYTEIRYLDGRAVPGIVVGAPLSISSVAAYELYYLFPLTEQSSTLDLVRSAVVGTGILLVLLLGAIAVIVTRQVVAPVRSAARTAEQFSEGHLSERMQVRGEDDLARLATSFNEMATSLEDQIHRLENLSAVQQRFVSDVSHELRTPLTTIRMAADVLFESRDAFDQPTARAAELLQTQLDRFENLLADLLEISRYDAGAAILDLETVDLDDLVARAVEGVRPLADRRATRISVETQSTPLPVECDPRRIERVLRNLLDNAVEHGEGEPIDITLGGDDDAVAVTVRDHGVGLADDQIQHVFDRFWRADPARARQTGGTGLGLAIALEDTRLHAGMLDAWGRPGQGACFRLTLPRRADVLLDASPLPLPDDGENHDAPVDAVVLEDAR